MLQSWGRFFFSGLLDIYTQVPQSNYPNYCRYILIKYNKFSIKLCTDLDHLNLYLQYIFPKDSLKGHGISRTFVNY